MFRAALKSLLGRKVRLLMSTFAVVLGVAFVAGTLVFTDTLGRSFTALFASTVGDVVVSPVKADAEEVVAGTPGQGASAPRPSTLPVSLVAKLAKVDGAARADGNVLATSVIVFDKENKPLGTLGAPSLAGNWTGAPAGHGLTGLEIVTGREPRGPGEIVLDAITTTRSGHTIGGDVNVVVGDEVVTTTLVGVADFAEGGSFSGATWVGFETKAAQKLFLPEPDTFHTAWVTAEPGVSQAELRDAVAKVLPEGYEARTGDDVADESASGLLRGISFLTTFLLIFAGISLVVGAFLIVNTFSILVAQRSKELALFRALGASRRQVSASVLLEALVVGIAGSTLGIGLGIVMAMVIRALFGTFGLDLSGQPLVFAPRTFVVAYVVGILVTMTAAGLPARRTTKIAPVQAMRDDVAMPETSLRNRFAGGLVLVALGGLSLWHGLGDDVANAVWYVGGGILAILLGVAAAAPVLCQPFLLAARWFFAELLGTVGHLAGQNSLRNPRRTTATASALMIGLALATTMAIVGDSAKASVDRALAENFRGDYVASNVSGQSFPATVAQEMRKVEGVRDVAALRFAWGQVVLDGEPTPQGFTAAPPGALQGLVGLQRVVGRTTDLRPGEAVLGETYARERGVRVGGRLRSLINSRRVTLKVVGIFADTPVVPFPVVTSPKTFERLKLGDRDNFLIIDVESPSAIVEYRLSQVVAELPTVILQDQSEFAAEQREPIDQMVLMIFALLGLALFIAVLGIVNTLALSIIERTREIGLLRAIGLNRSQLRRMITVESVVIALLGAGLGIGLGVGFGIALMKSLRDEGLEVIAVPWDQLGLFGAVALLVGVLAAVLPARRAARLDVLQAISTA
ncbi:ABC transporter permease [Nocardioides daphniae]|uniref:Membrane protein n=1 Tax=Nocardioides daphniae TaxID=402297 RepID=A0ABQ1QDZ5_9ACTN|nr:FtsX-like permease family protein [Nocardioides daphniae]GGD22854.1 membrane protein [Nocardioides daphniae]